MFGVNFVNIDARAADIQTFSENHLLELSVSQNRLFHRTLHEDLYCTFTVIQENNMKLYYLYFQHVHVVALEIDLP